MDSYVDTFQANGGSMIMLAKGNRSKQVKHKDIIILLLLIIIRLFGLSEDEK